MTDSCCTAETNTTLQSNFSPIKKKKPTNAQYEDTTCLVSFSRFGSFILHQVCAHLDRLRPQSEKNVIFCQTL